MSDSIDRALSRRHFLTVSALATASFTLAESAFSQEPAQGQPAAPSDQPKKNDQPEADTSKDQKPAPPAEGSSGPVTLKDSDGIDYRECPQCGFNMYRQDRTWTCENCGYSYTE